MSDGKNSMIFYYDWQNLFEELTDAEIGQLVMAALKYDQTGEDTKFKDKGMRVAFKAIKNSIKVSNEKYHIACEKKRLAMERRWNKNKKEDSDVYKSIDNYRENSDTDTDTETHTDTVTDTDTESGSGGIEPPQPPLSELDVMRIEQAWNEQDCTQHISGLTKTRRKKVQECGDLQLLVCTINTLDQQQYLVKQAKAGKAVTFDWFIQPDNFRKVLEGNYRETFGGGTGGKLARNW